MGILEYYDPDTDGTVYHVSPGPSTMTEDDADSMFMSSAGSLTSDVTIHTEDLPGYFVTHNGRQHPATPGIARWFPSDNIRRYILRTLVNKWIFGGNYVGPVKEALAPLEGGRQRCALELGTRAGTWVQEMANEFRHVQFRTVDVAPIIAHAPRSNICFEVYDFTEGLLLPDESQDVVFLNMVFEMVRDYRGIIREAYRVLRPGGLLYINDFSPRLWNSLNFPVPARQTNPVGCHLFDIVRAQISKLGMNPDMCDHLPQWLAPNSDLWNDRGKGFENICSTTKTYPAYPHEGHACASKLDSRILPFVGHLSVMSTRDMVGILVDGGMSLAEAEMLVEGTIEEMRRPECCAMLKSYCIYATKTKT
ncbi:methyltransferase domain protein [Ceratobasidium sp. AG-Ba]|nr:methyltransferase domain protein [Ceratobasidium sp. AG-Ba]QRW10955.1 methyltransferase domain protein [Ceratobasidium sp. AG-Ba]